MALYEQIFPYIDLETGNVKERHVYLSPLGEGYIDIEYKLQESILYYKAQHFGPADIESHDWLEVDLIESKIKVKGSVDVFGVPTEIESSENHPIILLMQQEIEWIGEYYIDGARQETEIRLTESYKAIKKAELESA
jgi:hypothetical protein